MIAPKWTWTPRRSVAQLSFEPRRVRELVPLLFHGQQLDASVPEPGEGVHTYRFHLQPNDRALRGIGLNCYHAAM
jgi:hypothetical protein